MGVSGSIQDDRVRAVAHGSVEGVNQYTFPIRLQADQLHTTGRRTTLQRFIDLSERSVTIDLRLTPTQEVQVWPMQDQDLQLRLREPIAY